jgi:hypothetical protein
MWGIMTPTNGISVQVTIGSIRAKVDGSLGFNVSTPELSPEEKVAFMALQNNVLEAVFQPLDNPEATILPIETEKGVNTQSQRIRSVLFVLWTKMKDAGEYVDDDFNAFYRKDTEKYILSRKEKIESYE